MSIAKSIVLLSGESVNVTGKFIDITGRVFGGFTVLGLSRKKDDRWLFSCRCECGEIRDLLASSLTSGNSTSCGCRKRKITSDTHRKHGQSENGIYNTWLNIKSRCYNPKNNHFKSYGGRGIKLCAGWHDSVSFFGDMGSRPPGHSIDRINNDGNYSCGHCDECAQNGWTMNCRWADAWTQANNKSNNRVIEFNGEKRTLTEWADLIGIKPRVLHDRLFKLKWSIEKTFTEPLLIRTI